jgi:hypothetical protein
LIPFYEFPTKDKGCPNHLRERWREKGKKGTAYIFLEIKIRRCAMYKHVHLLDGTKDKD